jgi:hypothetical protein
LFGSHRLLRAYGFIHHQVRSPVRPEAPTPKEETVSQTLEDLIPADAVTRVRVLLGDNDSPELRKGRKAIAFSECTYQCPDTDITARCIEALRESDARLRVRHDSMMLWSWNSTWMEPHPEDGTSTIILGVAWYDREFFEERKDAGIGKMHRLIYDEIGVDLADVDVTHWVLGGN